MRFPGTVSPPRPRPLLIQTKYDGMSLPVRWISWIRFPWISKICQSSPPNLKEKCFPHVASCVKLWCSWRALCGKVQYDNKEWPILKIFLRHSGLKSDCTGPVNNPSSVEHELWRSYCWVSTSLIGHDMSLLFWLWIQFQSICDHLSFPLECRHFASRPLTSQVTWVWGTNGAVCSFFHLKTFI